MTERDGRLGPSLALGGAVLLGLGTVLHPMAADPNDAVAAFAEYAADRYWVLSHLMQLFGVIGAVGALVLLARHLANSRAANWAVLARTGAFASLAGAAALQAVDGVALKRAVEAWTATRGADQAYWFYAAVAVRQIEIGLAAMLSLVFGLTAMLFAVALWTDGRAPRWFALLPVVGGVGTFVAGLIMAFNGFSVGAMMVGMPANALLLVWLVALAVLWRRVA